MDQRTADISRIAVHLNESHKKLIIILKNLAAGCKEIEAYYGEYDYDKETQANGYRSYVAMVDCLIRNVARLVPATTQKKRSDLKDYEVVGGSFLKLLVLLQRFRAKGSSFDPSLVTDLDVDLLAEVFSFSETEIRPIFGRLGPFWLPYFVRKDVKILNAIVAWINCSLMDKIKMLFSSSFSTDKKVKDAIIFPVQSIKDIPFDLILRFVPKPFGVKMKNILIERKSEWIVGVRDTVSPAVLHKTAEARVGAVRCFLISPLVKHDNGCLVIHIHGGAFMVGRPEMFMAPLTMQAIALNVTVLSIDYGLAPEHKYPEPLQDILDVYLFLTSGSVLVQEMLGFYPKKIILTGESSGGNQAIALTIALQMIRKAGEKVLLPKGLSIQYPCSTPGPMTFASALSICVDAVLSAGLCSLTFVKYAAIDPPAGDDWHRQANKKNVMRRLTERVKDPLYNVLVGNYLEEMKNIKLSLVVCEFDPILDQGIAIAKRWGGEKKVMVARGMPHGMVLRFDKIAKEMAWIKDGMADQLGVRAKKE